MIIYFPLSQVHKDGQDTEATIFLAFYFLTSFTCSLAKEAGSPTKILRGPSI
jgi:hypothetical protein